MVRLKVVYIKVFSGNLEGLRMDRDMKFQQKLELLASKTGRGTSFQECGP